MDPTGRRAPLTLVVCLPADIGERGSEALDPYEKNLDGASRPLVTTVGFDPTPILRTLLNTLRYLYVFKLLHLLHPCWGSSTGLS